MRLRLVQGEDTITLTSGPVVEEMDYVPRIPPERPIRPLDLHHAEENLVPASITPVHGDDDVDLRSLLILPKRAAWRELFVDPGLFREMQQYIFPVVLTRYRFLVAESLRPTVQVQTSGPRVLSETIRPTLIVEALP